MAENYSKNSKNNPILNNFTPKDNSITFGEKLLSILCIIQSIISSPIAYVYIIDYINNFKDGLYGTKTISTFILYTIFLLGMIFLIVLLVSIGINLLTNNRRIAALHSNIAAIVVAIATASDMMIVGITPVIYVLVLAIILLIALKSVIDPSLRDERRLQNKLRDLQNKSDFEKGHIGFKKDNKIKINYFNMFWLFFIMCIIGYIFEIIWHVTIDDPGHYQERAGLLFGPFSPIYGFGALIITLVLNKFSNKNIGIIFLIGGIFGSLFEYLCSIYLETCFGVKSWDYSHLPLNINGRTSIIFFLIWGVIDVIWIKFFLKTLVRIINKIPWKLRYSITIITTAFMIVNMIMTFSALDCWYTRSSGYPPETPLEQFYNQHFNDEFMKSRFENMKMTPESAVGGQE